MSDEQPVSSAPFDVRQALAEQRAEDLNQLRVRNQTKLAGLHSQGAGLEPLSVFTKRLELLIEMLLPENTENRVIYEISYEQQISNVLDEAESAVRRAKLTSSMHVPVNGKVVPNLLTPGDSRG